MKREHLLTPGDFVSIPSVVLASDRIDSAAKLVYGAVLDHLGENAEAWPSQPRIARRTCLSERGVRNALAQLVKQGFLTRTGTAGRCSVYRFTDPATATPVPSEPRQPLPGSATVEDAQPRHSLPVTPEVNAGVPRQGMPVTPAMNASELLNGTTEGEPQQVITSTSVAADSQPIRRRPARPAEAAVSVDLPSHLDDPDDPPDASIGVRVRVASDEVLAICNAYPRRVGLAPARSAIQRALKRLRKRSAAAADGQDWADWLLGVVRVYAAARERSIQADPSDHPKFTPHPARWFDKERYDDDPAEWEPKTRPRNGHANGHHRPVATTPAGQFAEPDRDLPEFGRAV